MRAGPAFVAMARQVDFSARPAAVAAAAAAAAAATVAAMAAMAAGGVPLVGAEGVRDEEAVGEGDERGQVSREAQAEGLQQASLKGKREGETGVGGRHDLRK